MKLFISWSGFKSKKLANELRNWLPLVIQLVKPYFSPDDVDKGSRWASEISKELENSDAGIICLTRNNLESAWLMFEAGALAKSLDKSRVVPILFDIEPVDIKGPLAQFQATKFEEEDMLRLLKMINTTLGADALDQKVLEASFNVWWPRLNDQIHSILTGPNEDESISEPRSDREIMEEILEHVRALRSEHADSISENVQFLGDEPFLDQSIDDLDLTTRAKQCLKAEGIYHIGQLVQYRYHDLIRTPNLGRKSCIEIQEKLAKYGLSLNMRLPLWEYPKTFS